jgi:hypothetical protein
LAELIISTVGTFSSFFCLCKRNTFWK